MTKVLTNGNYFPSDAKKFLLFKVTTRVSQQSRLEVISLFLPHLHKVWLLWYCLYWWKKEKMITGRKNLRDLHYTKGWITLNCFQQNFIPMINRKFECAGHNFHAALFTSAELCVLVMWGCGVVLLVFFSDRLSSVFTASSIYGFHDVSW